MKCWPEEWKEEGRKGKCLQGRADRSTGNDTLGQQESTGTAWEHGDVWEQRHGLSWERKLTCLTSKNCELGESL